jgi:hypothetical protein
MARRPRRPPRAKADEAPILPQAPAAETLWNTPRVTVLVVILLLIHLTLAVRSLVLENPTVDEVIHLPAGITYWQKGTFALYHHNPPLVKLIAALPVLATPGVKMDYSRPSWADPPNKAAFAHEFAQDNYRQYFELFSRARVVMPLFSVLGALVIFSWSRALYGAGGGLLSLALWVFCPNVLAHCRLVTTDVGAAVLGVLATFLFWRYLKQPSWIRAVVAGLGLGIAQITKFSLILLYGLWPLLGLVHLLANPDRSRLARRLGLGVAQAALMLALSVLVIDAGYAFEGVGAPLGKYEFVSGALTRPVPPGMWRPPGPDRLMDACYRHRVNRFRGTWLGLLPAPLPRHYLLGFDDQKLEAEGIPARFLDPAWPDDEIKSYPVYLDGVIQQKSWWYYYILTLVYKVPEGTWALAVGALAVLIASRRSRAPWFDELVLLLIPAAFLFVMSVFTNIDLGLRYVLPTFPFVFISAGKLVPWAQGFRERGRRRAAAGFVMASLAATTAGTLAVAPHYLAYFNQVSGGPANGSAHLIDSNLDWGQDLVGLKRWLEKHAPDERVGLAYFGQINPELFRFRDGGGFDWFLPPPLPGTMNPKDLPQRYRRGLEGIRPEPGLYAVSASLVRGLPWRVYDAVLPRFAPFEAGMDAFGYFRELTPFGHVGHSILLYRITPEQADRLARHWSAKPAESSSPPPSPR